MEIPAGTRHLIDRLTASGNVVALGVGGSRATGTATMGSDIDLYVLTSQRIDPDIRRRIMSPLADPDHPVEIANPYWGDEDACCIDGVWHDIVFFDAEWFFGEIERTLIHHQAREGYSTSFVFTLANMTPLVDPVGALATWQAWIGEYPDALAAAIISANVPVSCTIHACYRNQIARAIALADPVAVNHRVAAFLACVFDIAFAHLRLWHPGEKRQLQYLANHADRLPERFCDHIVDLLAATAPDRVDGLLPAVDRVVADITRIARAEQL